MGMVQTEITIKNVADEIGFREGRLKEHEVRTVTVTAVVDTGAATLVIGEELRQILGLGIKEERKVMLADGGLADCKVTDAVNVQWKDRNWSCPAVSFPRVETVLLGAIPLEGMDLMVNPKTQEVVGVHGDVAQLMIL